jgi:hypothetical protein
MWGRGMLATSNCCPDFDLDCVDRTCVRYDGERAHHSPSRFNGASMGKKQHSVKFLKRLRN